MKLRSDMVQKILDDARGKTESDKLIDHSICVGYAAGKIAQVLNQKGQDLDIDKAKTLDYLHNIGKMVEPFRNHIMNGYHYLKSQGYDEKFCNITLTHSMKDS